MVFLHYFAKLLRTGVTRKTPVNKTKKKSSANLEHKFALVLLPVIVFGLLLYPVLAVLGSTTSSIWSFLETKTGEFFARLLHNATLFTLLFTFRYLRLIVHLFSFWFLYQPAKIPADPSFGPRDCSIIIPTVEPENPGLKESLESCLYNSPGEILIVTVGESMVQACEKFLPHFRIRFPSTPIKVISCPVANKRRQVATAIPFVSKSIVVLLDDHVFWPSGNFLPAAIAPFEDSRVGAVGTNKRVRRTEPGFTTRAFWNMLGAIYLERHNFEIRATNAIDGGVFVVSGRTSLWRASILQESGFVDAYLGEKFFFGRFGPLNADDDNFLTRWVVARGWNIKIQYCQDSLVETTLGEYPKFLSQCLRWVRTTWRSNSTSLFTDRTVWRRQPWCVYAVYATSFVNFALFYDAILIFSLIKSPSGSSENICCLVAWIFLTKLIKLTAYFRRHPWDLFMLPGYLLFAYFHSFIKLYAGLTFFVTAWGGRNLDEINARQATTETVTSVSPGELPTQDNVTEHTPATPIRTQFVPRIPFHIPVQGERGFFEVPFSNVTSTNPYITPSNILKTHFPSTSSAKKAVSPLRQESEETSKSQEQARDPAPAPVETQGEDQGEGEGETQEQIGNAGSTPPEPSSPPQPHVANPNPLLASRDPWIASIEDEDYYEREFGVPEARKHKNRSSSPSSQTSSEASSPRSLLFSNPASKSTSSSNTPLESRASTPPAVAVGSGTPSEVSSPAEQLTQAFQSPTNPFVAVRQAIAATVSSGYAPSRNNPFNPTGPTHTPSRLRLRLGPQQRPTVAGSQLRAPLAPPPPESDTTSLPGQVQIKKRGPSRARDQLGRMWIRGPQCDTLHIGLNCCPFSGARYGQSCSLREIWEL